MDNDDFTIAGDLICDLLARKLNSPLLEIETPAMYVSECVRLASEAELGCESTEFQPFWKCLRRLARAAGRTMHPVPGKWLLRSRVHRALSKVEIEEFVMTHAKLTLDAAQEVQNAHEDSWEPESAKGRLIRISIEFCEKLCGAPSVLINANAVEIKALESAAEQFIPIE